MPRDLSFIGSHNLHRFSSSLNHGEVWKMKIGNSSAPMCSLKNNDLNDEFKLSFPTQICEKDFICYLESLGKQSTIGGGGLGTGVRLDGLSRSMVEKRNSYKMAIEVMVQEVQRMKAQGKRPRAIAEFVVNKRRNLAHQFRSPSENVLFGIRDLQKYGKGGRNIENMTKYYQKKGLSTGLINEALTKGAQRSNPKVSEAVIRGAKGLRYAKGVVIISVGLTAYELLTTPKDQLEKKIYAETGSFVGGAVGSGTAVGLAIVFGFASGGLGFLVCGILGGALGGHIGSQTGEYIYTVKEEKMREIQQYRDDSALKVFEISY